LVIECKIIRVRFGRFYLLIVDTFFWWSYFALPPLPAPLWTTRNVLLQT
jgi:hypothetical protein